MASTNTNTMKSWFADTTYVPAIEAAPEALVLNEAVATQTATPGGDAQVVRIPFIDADPEAQIVAEGAEFAEGDPKPSEIYFGTQKIGLLHKVSNEAYASVVEGDGNNKVADQLAASLERAIVKKADSLFLTAPVQETSDNVFPSTGLMNFAGVVDGGAITTKTLLSPLIDALAQVADNGATPSALVMSNGAWAKILKLAYADGRPVVDADVQTDTTPMLYGLPVIRNSAMPANGILVVDATDIVTGFSDVEVATDSSVYFNSDSVALRVKARVGWTLIHQNRAAKLTVD